jgi:hypothetical protein
MHTSGSAGHSESAAQARHIIAVVLQTGVVPEQSVFARQPTQVLVAALHAGVGAAQSVLTAH